jgi:hypothetical protein
MRIYADIEADKIESQEHFYRILNDACARIYESGVADDWEIVRVGYQSNKPIVARDGKTWAKNDDITRRKKGNAEASTPAGVDG